MTGDAMVPGPVCCISPVPERTLCLAKWSSRFFAWLIDIIIIILFVNILRGIFEPFWHLPLLWDYARWEILGVVFEAFFVFLYWTVMEGFEGRGQSIGKMVMNLRVVNRDGSKISWKAAAIESFGKAFVPLLLFDCLIGWLAMPESKQRVFNRISGTIVIRTDYREPAGITYVRD